VRRSHAGAEGIRGSPVPPDPQRMPGGRAVAKTEGDPARRFSRESGWTSGLEVRQLRAFVTLMNQGSMTAAARMLGVAQSTVSEALAALERALGTPAVARRRGAHGIALTVAGQALLPHAQSVLASVEDAHVAVAGATREARGLVDVIANESISTYLLPRALDVLRQGWPNTRFAVTVGSCHSVHEGLANGRFDIGLVLQARSSAAAGVGGSSQGAQSTAAVLSTEVPLVLFCSPGHPFASQASRAQVPRHRLAPYPVFASDASGDFHTLLCDFFRKDGPPGARLESTGSVEAVKRTVVTNPLALGVLPAYAIEEELRASVLQAVGVVPGLPRVGLSALWSLTRPMRPAAAELVEVLRTTLSPSATCAESRGLRPRGRQA
jgi:DNA-binding transcriptional LysR family regulator